MTSKSKYHKNIPNSANFEIQLLAGQKAPDYSSTARFRTGFLADARKNLFYQMVHRLETSRDRQKKPYPSTGQS